MSVKAAREKQLPSLSDAVGWLLDEAEDRATGALLRLLETHALEYPTLDEEFANLSGAIARAATRDDAVTLIELLGPLGNFLYERGHWTFAVGYLPTGVAASRRTENPWREALLRQQLGIILGALGDQPAARAELERALALARRLGDTAVSLSTACGLAQACAAEGDYDAADRYVATSEALRDQADEPPDAGLRHTMAMLQAARGDHAAALRAHRKNLREARRASDASGTARALYGMGVALAQLGRFGRAAACLRLARACATSAGDALTEAAALHSLAMEEARRGRQGAAYELYQESLEVSRRLDDRRGVARTLAQIGELFLDFRVYDAAGRHYQEALKALIALGDRPGQTRILHQLGNIFVHERRYDDAVAAYERSLAIKRESNDQRGIGLTLACLGELARRRGNPDEAKRLWTESLARLRPLRVPEADEVTRWLNRVRRCSTAGPADARPRPRGGHGAPLRAGRRGRGGNGGGGARAGAAAEG